MKEKILGYLKENNYLNDKTLLVSVVGSRMWQMEHEGSDWDIFIVINEPLENMLNINYRSINKEFKYELDGVELDIKIKEIKDVLKQLYKNNPNFIFGILSDNVIYESDVELMRELRAIIYKNINYQIFPPLKGMINHHYQKYFINKTHDKSGKKETIIRKIAWLYRMLSQKNIIGFDYILPPHFDFLMNCNGDVKDLKLEEIVELINKIEIPDWSKVENEINDFNRFLLKLKI